MASGNSCSILQASNIGCKHARVAWVVIKIVFVCVCVCVESIHKESMENYTLQTIGKRSLASSCLVIYPYILLFMLQLILVITFYET